jgi:Glucosamine 6-phosphate synthetase, contains amidotransferase and phosphosugar isomerase domains
MFNAEVLIMCGIFGYIGPHQAAPLLVEGLRRLEYRGYDSTGIAVKNGAVTIHKKVGKVQELRSILPSSIKGQIGIAHTRWATHGGVTDENAHPMPLLRESSHRSQRIIETLVFTHKS